jgi:exosortase family protein XrtF
MKEFRPALRFLLVFLVLYFVGNVVYGLWIQSYDGLPDAATRIVALQTSGMLNVLGYSVEALENTQGPTVFLNSGGKLILNIYEGCNGINVMIVFTSFVVAFGGSYRKMIPFVPGGLIIIHLANVVRLILLFWVAIGYHRYFYYVHKYFFTAAIYLIVLVLWLLWISVSHGKRNEIKPVN